MPARRLRNLLVPEGCVIHLPDTMAGAPQSLHLASMACKSGKGGMAGIGGNEMDAAAFSTSGSGNSGPTYMPSDCPC